MMRFQKQRDPESLLIESRAAELAAKGYPPIAHDNAMDAEEIIRNAKKNKKVIRTVTYDEPSFGG